MPDMGHNSGEAANASFAAERLRSLVARIERLEEERKALAGDVKDIYVEAKTLGFDAKVLRQFIALRKRDPNEVAEAEALLELYRRALGDGPAC